MPDSAKFTVSYFPRVDSPDAWPQFWQADADGTLHDVRIAAELSIETTFPTAERFEITDSAGDVVYLWPVALQS